MKKTVKGVSAISPCVMGRSRAGIKIVEDMGPGIMAVIQQ
jgi:hypothetical protein